MRPRPNAAEKELRSLLLAVSLIRILNCVSKTPMPIGEISKQLRTNGTAIDGPSLNRTLLSLHRRGLAKTRNCAWSLTPDGRKALKLAISGVKELTPLIRS